MILILDILDKKLLNLLQENYKIVTDYYSSKEEVEEKIHLYEGIVFRSRFKIDKNFISKANNLKFIARVGSGLENIDISVAKEHKIQIISSPEGSKQAVAEHSLGLLLSLTKKIFRSNIQIKNNLWQREENRGFEICGKTIAIIGYGNVGSTFAKLLSGFDARVISFDIKKNYADKNTEEVTMTEIFKEADILSIHTPLTDLTYQMCNNNYFDSFKKDIFFINTARGKIVNTKHLINNIKSGKIIGAGLDVLEYEKFSFETVEHNDDLIFLKNNLNVVLTPHIGGWSFESNDKMSDIIFNKIQSLYNTFSDKNI